MWAIVNITTGGAPGMSIEQRVHKIRRILEELGREIATPAEDRAMLHLKGGDHVTF